MVSEIKTHFRKSKPERVIVVGDVHGDLPRLKSILRHAGLIDDMDAWKGADSVLVQLGDSIDRTPEGVPPLEAFYFLRSLQDKARQSGGSVIRLIGNHELMLLQGFYSHALMDTGWSLESKLAMERFAEGLKREIISETVLGVWNYKDVLFLHGGLRTNIRESVMRYVYKNRLPFASSEPKLAQALATAINGLLKQAVARDDYSHPIFWIGKARGGDRETGGVFWTDFCRDFPSSLGALKVRQVVGHTPVSIDSNIMEQKGQWRIICMDTAISRGYEGKGVMSYLELANGRGTIWYSVTEEDDMSIFRVLD